MQGCRNRQSNRDRGFDCVVVRPQAVFSSIEKPGCREGLDVGVNVAVIAPEVHPSLPVHGVAELIAYAKQHPGELNYGTYGIGSTAHLNMELFQALTGTKLVPIHYNNKGAAPAMTDVIAGHIQLMYVSAASAVQPAAAGQVRFLAVGAAERMALLPDVPTVAEGGVPGYRSVSWFGLFAPAGTPRPVVDKINSEVREFFADPAVRKNFLDPQLFEPIAGTPEQLADYLSAESQKWSKVIHDANIKAE